MHSSTGSVTTAGTQKPKPFSTSTASFSLDKVRIPLCNTTLLKFDDSLRTPPPDSLFHANFLFFVNGSHVDC